MTDACVELRNVTAGYSGGVVLDRLSFRAIRGEVVGITGENASGKSTLLRVIFGLLSPYSGEVIVGRSTGAEIVPYRLARRGVAFVPQQNGIFRSMTVGENLQVALEASGKSICENRIVELLHSVAAFGIAKNQVAGFLSGGQQRVLAVARCSVVAADLLLLDEPFAGVADDALTFICSAIKACSDAGGTALVVDHRDEILRRVASRCCTIRSGKIVDV